MSKMQRVPSVPLITCDPYFSVWSPADHLYDSDTCSWTGKVKPVRGIVSVDDRQYVFMGLPEGQNIIPQTGLEIMPTSSEYEFTLNEIRLKLRFTTPLLLTDLDLISRPASYIDFSVVSADGKPHAVSLFFSFDESHCHDGEEPEDMIGGSHRLSGADDVWFGKRKQAPLSHSGDSITIDWGYLYLAVPSDVGKLSVLSSGGRAQLCAEFSLGEVLKEKSGFLTAVYDDVASINYFGDIRKAYWTRSGDVIFRIIEKAVKEHDGLLSRCELFDSDLRGKAYEIAGDDYALICSLAYRQTIAAHKLILDTDGNVVFLSKECLSNGCIGTVDVSYPSVPLYLMYAPELVKGMMRPIFKFAQMPVWNYDFAPHDVGRYPYATGQVYGRNDTEKIGKIGSDGVYPPYYAFPENSGVYKLEDQMPVEECGNMLIMAAAVSIVEGSAGFALKHRKLLEQWVGYLLRYGADPGEQLCTDDFAGHFPHNVNLAAKAVMGVEAYSILMRMGDDPTQAGIYHRAAERLAESWAKRARSEGHTRLVFDSPDGWSLKYNLVWDILFDSGLFPKSLYKQEIKWYIEKENAYGVPLDSRKAYTKSDWILWCVAMAEEKADREALIEPLGRYLRETPSRTPFSDWYSTVTAKEESFQNRTVQGGLFMPMLKEKFIATHACGLRSGSK